MKKILTLFTLLILSATGVQAQFGYGFKTGINFNSFSSDDIREGEEFVNTTGFHIGAAFGYKFTELMGARAELLYSIRGGRIRYDGEGAFPLVRPDGSTVVINGTRRSTLRINNNYLEVPVTFYYKPAPWIELSVGAQAGVLIGSTAIGQQGILGTANIDDQLFNVNELRFNLDYNYGKDSFDDTEEINAFVEIAGENVTYPSSIGAYYEYDRDYGKPYETFDFSAVGGISFFLNKGLYVGARANIGLRDITRNEADRVSVLAADGVSLETVQRDDTDTNRALQVSVGFIF